MHLVSWPTRLKTLFPSFLLLNSDWYRLPNLTLASLDLIALGFFVYKFGSDSKWLSILAVFSLAITPLFVHSSIFDFSSMLILGVFIGLLFALHSRKWLPAGICLLLYIGAALYTDGLGWQSYLSSMPTPASIKLDVDDRIRTEYRINNSHDILPINLKRLVYNKYYWIFRLGLPEWVKVWDFDWWLAPSQIGSTVSRNIWGEKGLPRILFFQAALAVYALFTLRQSDKKLVTMCITTFVVVWLVTSIGAQEVLERAATPLLIPISLLSALGLLRLWSHGLGKLVAVFTVVIAFSGITATLDHIFRHELYWRDNRPYIFSQMTTLLDRCSQEPAEVSNLLGPTQYYYAWTQHIDPAVFWHSDPDSPQLNNVLFKHFDLSHDPTNPHSCFVGLPGEFLGNRVGKSSGQNTFTATELSTNFILLKQVTFRDAVSYGNGNFIWLIKKNI